MSTFPAAPPGTGVRRVRHQARESFAVMATSAGLSATVAVALMLLASLAR
jgi:hypothetical protein